MGALEFVLVETLLGRPVLTGRRACKSAVPLLLVADSHDVNTHISLARNNRSGSCQLMGHRDDNDLVYV
jgi:hypothetical protein